MFIGVASAAIAEHKIVCTYRYFHPGIVSAIPANVGRCRKKLQLAIPVVYADGVIGKAAVANGQNIVMAVVVGGKYIGDDNASAGIGRCCRQISLGKARNVEGNKRQNK